MLTEIDRIAALNHLNRSETIRKMIELFVDFHRSTQPLQFLQYADGIDVRLPQISMSRPLKGAGNSDLV